MAILKLKGDPAGTATYTVITPGGNTDRSITIPDASGTLLNAGSTLDATKLSGALPAIDGAALTGIDSLPSQTSQSGKYLTTNGTTASWGTLATVFPFYKTDGTSDTITITNGQFPFYKADGTADNIGVS
jgi:hypothetical protein